MFSSGGHLDFLINASNTYFVEDYSKNKAIIIPKNIFLPKVASLSDPKINNIESSNIATNDSDKALFDDDNLKLEKAQHYQFSQHDKFTKIQFKDIQKHANA
jgi:hypothetical protein